MWAAQSIELTAAQRSSRREAWGDGLRAPAAIGAAAANPSQPYVVIAGRWRFQLNCKNCKRWVRNHLPIKIVIVNNQTHGMVRQFQESYFGARYQSTYIRLFCAGFCPRGSSLWH